MMSEEDGGSQRGYWHDPALESSPDDVTAFSKTTKTTKTTTTTALTHLTFDTR
jgi:hypothetical protein